MSGIIDARGQRLKAHLFSSSARSARPVIHRPNQPCHLLLWAQLFTLILPHCPKEIIQDAALIDGRRR